MTCRYPLSIVSEYAGNIRDAQGLGGRNKKTQKMHASAEEQTLETYAEVNKLDAFEGGCAK